MDLLPEDMVARNSVNTMSSRLSQNLWADASEANIGNEKKCLVEPKCSSQPRFNAWISRMGNYTNDSSQSQIPNYDAGMGGVVAGLDYHAEFYLKTAGGGIAYAHTDIGQDNGVGSSTINQGALMLYSTWVASDWYFDLAFWGGKYWSDNTRYIFLPGIASAQATSSTHGWQFTPHFEVGYDYKHDWGYIEPFDMMDCIFCWEEGYTETGAGKVNMGQQNRNCSLLRNELGVRFSEILSYNWGGVTLMEKASYAYQQPFNTTFNAFIVGIPATFSITAFDQAYHLGVIGFETHISPKNWKYPYGTISFQTEFNSSYQVYQGMASVGKDF